MDLLTYTELLLDPFSGALNQPKLLDGKFNRTAGVRFRQTGEITCSATGFTYIALIPGLSNILCWQIGTGDVTTPIPFVNHIGTVADKANINRLRMVGAAVKLSMLNSADQNDGYWEAVRVPTQTREQSLAVGTSSLVHYNMFQNAIAMDIANSPTYMRGKLRDIHRYMFKLNSSETDHNWGIVSDAPVVEQVLDTDWDTVIIRIKGRVDAATPSVLSYEAISNQEVVYKENTALGRLMTPSPMVPETGELLQKTRFEMPAVQIE